MVYLLISMGFQCYLYHIVNDLLFTLKFDDVIINMPLKRRNIMFEKVKEVLVEALNVDENQIKLEASLKDDLGIDSLAAVELSLELESQFDVKIEDEELMNLKTVADIVNLLEGK